MSAATTPTLAKGPLHRRTRESPSAGSTTPHYSLGQRRLLVWGGAVVLGLWCVGLAVFSTTLYRRANLQADFGAYSQAWTLIGQGHLNPRDTISLNNVPFLRNDFELIIWPLALLHLVTPKAIVLLWIQDLAIAGTWFVAYRWILEYLEQRKVAWRITVVASLLVLTVIVIDPTVYGTLLFDWHIEPLSTFFIVMIGWSLWRGQSRRAFLWVIPVLLCGTFASITLVGLGISAVLAGRSTRRQGMALMVIGVSWVGLISLIGANAGSSLNDYAYLAGRTTLPGGSGTMLVVLGIVEHPFRAFRTIGGRLGLLYAAIKPVGVIGIASAWGFGVPFVVLTTDVLNSSSQFIFQAYQNSAVFPFCLLGSVMVLTWVGQRWHWGAIVALVGALILFVQAWGYGISASPTDVRWALGRVPADVGHQLQHALAVIGPDDQVVATWQIMGRFSGRRAINFYSPGAVEAVGASHVYFVFFPPIDGLATPADDLAAITYAQHVLHARTVFSANDVTLLEWTPPAGQGTFVLPGASTQAPG